MIHWTMILYWYLGISLVTMVVVIILNLKFILWDGPRKVSPPPSVKEGLRKLFSIKGILFTVFVSLTWWYSIPHDAKEYYAEYKYRKGDKQCQKIDQH